MDLSLSNVASPNAATTGQQISITWTVTNQSTQAAVGSWQDSVYLSTTPTITSSSVLVGAAMHSNGLAANGTYNGSLTAAVPALPPGSYFVIVQVDSLHQVQDTNRSNNTLASTGQIVLSVPPLTLGTPFTGSFSASNQDQYYQIVVPVGGSLVVSLSSTAATGGLALYVSQGSLPTPFSFQEASAAANQPTQTVVVPQVLTAGTYYALAHSVSGNAATASYSLTVNQTAALGVSAFSPAAGGNAGNVTIEIDGTNFTPATTASLTLGGVTLNASAIDFINASQLFATFNLAAAAAGNYTLSVKQGPQSTPASATFGVVAANSGSLNVVLSTPEFVRSGRTGTIVITYTNQSKNDMVAPVLDISSTNTSVLFSTPDDPNNFAQDTQVLAVAPSGPAGILRPGQSGALTLTLLSEDTLDNDAIPIEVDQLQSGQPNDLASQQAPQLQPSTISTAAWNVIFGNLLTTVGTTSDSFNAALAQAATFISAASEKAPQTLGDVNNLWSFLVSQANATYPTARP